MFVRRANNYFYMICDDVLGIVFEGVCNPLEPCVAVNFSSASSGLRALTQARRQALKGEHEAAAALCRKVGVHSCKQLREASVARWPRKGLTATDLDTFGTLGAVLPLLQELALFRNVAAPDGVQRLAAGLGVGGLPAIKILNLSRMQMGDAGASAIGAAIGRGALPRLEALGLGENGIGDAGLVALAPALRRLTALATLTLFDNPFGDEGVAALVRAPPTGVYWATLNMVNLENTLITDAGCATLTSALHAGAMPALRQLILEIGWNLAVTPGAGTGAINAVHAALATRLASEHHRLPLSAGWPTPPIAPII